MVLAPHLKRFVIKPIKNLEKIAVNNKDQRKKVKFIYDFNDNDEINKRFFYIGQGINTDLFYPQNIYEDIQFIIKNYRLELNWENYNEGNMTDLVRDISEMIGKKGDIALFCMANYPWDFFNVVFTEIDRIQHFIWRYVDENHSLYSKGMAQKYYQSIIT